MAKTPDKISKARGRLLLNHPFFASLILSMPYEMTRDVPTAATDSKKHYYNPDFFDTLSIDEIMGVLAHESLHDALFHVLRLFGRNQRIWNMACDYSINKIVLDCNLKLPEGCLLDKELGKNSADVNYEILMQKSEEQRKQRRQSSGEPQDGQKGQSGGGGSQPPQDASGEAADGLKEDVIGRDMKDSTGGDPAEHAKRVSDMQQRVAQAATMARMAGKLPGSLERLITQILNPQVPWQEVLREFMSATCKSDESWARRNRRFSDTYLPTRFSESMGPIGLIGDTSGSITNDDLNKVAAEFHAIAEELRPERMHVLWADTKVAKEQVFEEGELPVFEAGGGGGTDMRVPLAYIERYEPQAVVLVTDGYTPWPTEEPPYPLIVVCTTNAPVPVGRVIRIH